MPSEGRRQRQPRVRHEAGDYVPSVTKEQPTTDKSANQEPKNTNAQEEKWVKIGSGGNEGKERESHSRPNESNDQSRFSHNIHRRRDAHKISERGRGGYRGRGQDRFETGNRRYENKPSTTNVAFAEERTYEPVMVMESKTDGTTKETSEPMETQQQPVQKYRRKEVISNWFRYEEIPPEQEKFEEGEDYLLGEDFSEVVSLNANKSSGGFLHLKGEMSWGQVSDDPLAGDHGLGALKVSDLVAAFETIPLFEQLKIPEESLPVFTVSTMRYSAEAKRSIYTPDRVYVTDIECNAKILESLKLNENVPFHLSAEGSNSDEPHHNVIDATLKFSSAFVPEADDVDLDTLLEEVREETPPELGERQDKKSSEQPIKNKKSQKKINPQQIKSEETPRVGIEKKELDFTIPKLSCSNSKGNEPKTSFDFGLSKTTKQAPTKSNKHNVIKKEKEKEIIKEEPKIDLDQPTKLKTEQPVLVNKTEVENLEDWLDSVLDD